MNSTPCGRVATADLDASSMRDELALGMSLMLESTRQEIEAVREILREAIDGIAGDLSEELLASAARRIEAVRCALERP